MNRRLTLRSDRLVALTTDELHAVHGAQAPLPTQMCISEYPTVVCSVLIVAVTGIVTGVVTTSTS